MRRVRTCTQDYTSVSGTTGDGIDGCVLHVQRVRWTTDEDMARRHLFVATRYRDVESGDFVLTYSPDGSPRWGECPEGAVPEYSFLTPMDADGRTFASKDEAWDFALERGYLQRFYTSPALRAENLADAWRTCPRCGSEDVGCFAASEEREDCADLTECHDCGLEGKGPDYRTPLRLMGVAA